MQSGVHMIQMNEQLGEHDHQILINPLREDRIEAYEPRSGVAESLLGLCSRSQLSR